MNKGTNNNYFVTPLMKFRQSLSLDQMDVLQITESAISMCESYSETEIAQYLSKALYPHTYDQKVVKLIEGLNGEVEKYDLLYSLKDLYNKIKRNNVGEMYSYPMKVVLECINAETDEDRMVVITNELMGYDWVPQIKVFLSSLTAKPQDRQNIMSNNGASAHPVYSVVEKCDAGDLFYLHNRWFLLTNEGKVQFADVSLLVDQNQQQRLYLLQEALNRAVIEDDVLSFKIDESLTIGISTSSKGLLINNEEAENETTLETIFESPLVHFMQKGLYPILLETYNSIKRFVEMDNMAAVTLITKPDFVAYAMNVKENQYVYTCSKSGSTLYNYDTALQLVEDIRNDTGYDLSYMFEDKLPEEIKTVRSLEEDEAVINLEINECHKAISIINENSDLLNISPEMNEAYETIQMKKLDLERRLKEVRSRKISERYSI